MVRLACMLTAIVLVAGLRLQQPYLTVECERLEPWKIVELWCADIVALWWFARFTMTHAIMGEPLLSIPFEDRRKQIRRVMITGISALLLDLGFTFYLMYDEHVHYAQGVVVEGQVLGSRISRRELETWYDLDCSFIDATGGVHTVHLRVEANKHALPAALPAETVETLLARDPHGKPVRVRYDPQWPARAWADGAGWDDGQRIYWFSLLTLMFQAIITALFLLLLVKISTGSALPWWWDLYKVMPLCVGAFWLFTMGLIDHLMDS